MLRLVAVYLIILGVGSFPLSQCWVLEDEVFLAAWLGEVHFLVLDDECLWGDDGGDVAVGVLVEHSFLAGDGREVHEVAPVEHPESVHVDYLFLSGIDVVAYEVHDASIGALRLDDIGVVEPCLPGFVSEQSAHLGIWHGLIVGDMEYAEACECADGVRDGVARRVHGSYCGLVATDEVTEYAVLDYGEVLGRNLSVGIHGEVAEEFLSLVGRHVGQGVDAEPCVHHSFAEHHAGIGTA